MNDMVPGPLMKSESYVSSKEGWKYSNSTTDVFPSLFEWSLLCLQ